MSSTPSGWHSPSAIASGPVTHGIGRRPDIDGLRAVAVVGVIINHFSRELLPGGHLGVDIFFVISGFVITASLLELRAESFAEFLSRFYEKRVKRLLPALVVCVAVTSFLICLFSDEPRVSLRTGIRALFAVSNHYLLQISADYFARSSDLNAFTHTWSLGVEEQFYVCFPLLLWFLVRRGPGPGLARLAVATAVASIFSLGTFLYLHGTNPDAAFYLMPARFWELGVGCFLFLAFRLAWLGRLHRAVSPTLVLGLLAAALFVPVRFSAYSTVAVVLLSALLIAVLPSSTVAYRILTNRYVVYIGLISYSLYLWHWSVLVISRWTIGIHWWTAPAQLALILLLAAASHKYVEKRWRLAEWSPSRSKSIAYGALLCLAAAAGLAILRSHLHPALFLGTETATVDRTGGRSERLALFSHATDHASRLGAKCNMTPHRLSGAAHRPQPTVDRDFIRSCIGGRLEKPKMILVGDSFAHVSANHLAAMAQEVGYEFRLIFGYSCPYPLRFRDIGQPARGQCSEVNEDLLWDEVVGALGQGDVLVVRLYFQNSRYIDYRGREVPPVDAYDRALAELAGAAATRGAKMLVVGANPTLGPDQGLSLRAQWFNLSADRIFTSPEDSLETQYFHRLDDHLRRVFEADRDLSYFSVKPSICGAADRCRIAEQSRLLYFDDHHLTAYAHDLFFDGLLARVRELATNAKL